MCGNRVSTCATKNDGNGQTAVGLLHHSQRSCSPALNAVGGFIPNDGSLLARFKHACFATARTTTTTTTPNINRTVNGTVNNNSNNNNNNNNNNHNNHNNTTTTTTNIDDDASNNSFRALGFGSAPGSTISSSRVSHHSQIEGQPNGETVLVFQRQKQDRRSVRLEYEALIFSLASLLRPTPA